MSATPALTSSTRSASPAASPGVHCPAAAAARLARAAAADGHVDRRQVGAPAQRGELALQAADAAAHAAQLRLDAGDLRLRRRAGERAQETPALGAGVGQPFLRRLKRARDVLQVLVALGDVAELGQRGQRLVEPLGRDAQLERRLAAVGVAGADLRARDDAAEAADGRDDRVGRRLELAVRRLDDEHGVALDLARRGGRDRQRAAAGRATPSAGGLGGSRGRAALRLGLGRLVGRRRGGLAAGRRVGRDAGPGIGRDGRLGRRRVTAAAGAQPLRPRAAAEHDDERHEHRGQRAGGRQEHPAPARPRPAHAERRALLRGREAVGHLLLEAGGEGRRHLRARRADVADELLELAQLELDGFAGERAVERVEVALLLGGQRFTMAHGRPPSAW